MHLISEILWTKVWTEPNICFTTCIQFWEKLNQKSENIWKGQSELKYSFMNDYIFQVAMQKSLHLLHCNTILPYFNIHISVPRAEVGTIFCLSWLITWYGHVLSDFRSIVRLYDYFIACHQLMPIYMAAAVSKNTRFNVECFSFHYCSISCISQLNICCTYYRLFCTGRTKSWHVNATCRSFTPFYLKYQMIYHLSNLLVILAISFANFHQRN